MLPMPYPAPLFDPGTGVIAPALTQEFLGSATNPPVDATFQYGFRGRRSWIGHSPNDPERQIDVC